MDMDQNAAEREMEFYGRYSGTDLDTSTPNGLRAWARNMDSSTLGLHTRKIMTGDVQALTAGRISSLRLARTVEALIAKEEDEGLTKSEEEILEIALGERISSE